MNKKRTGIAAVLAVWTAFVLGGCSDDATRPDRKISIGTFNSTLDTLAVGGRDYVLKADLWRDFMPIAEPGGSDLRVVAKLVALDSQPMPRGTDVTGLWVVNGLETWFTDELQDLGPAVPDSEIWRFAAGGPKWGPHLEVDVVVEVKFPNESALLLKVPDREIEATY